MTRCIAILGGLLLAGWAHAAPVVVRVTVASEYTDGTALPVASRVGATVYCGSISGQYTRAWSLESKADVVAVKVDIVDAAFCAATVVATAPNSAVLVESGFSPELAVNSKAAKAPSATIEQAVLCLQPCAVQRQRAVTVGGALLGAVASQ